MHKVLILTLAVTSILTSSSSSHSMKAFPKDFLFGVATSAYQTEGAWNINGKSENIWDHFTHTQPSKIVGNANGDVASNSYHKMEEDVKLLKDLGIDIYRFSLSWTRLIPSPLTNNVNPDGLRYYNALINLLVKNGIQPMATLYHWDLPQSLQELGGFTNELIIDAFVRYARVAFKNFGDRVKLWSTFNDPHSICIDGYGNGLMAPGYNRTGVADYLCGHNLLKAHAEAYHMYKKEFQSKQKGRISINLNSPWFEPASKSKDDVKAAERALHFHLGWFSQPLFSKSGDYPKAMRENIDSRSKKEGFPESRLPKFTKDEIKRVKGTCDFFSLNHFTTYLSANGKAEPIGPPSFYKDIQVNQSQDPNWPTTGSPTNRIVPWGFTKLLEWINKEYVKPEIYVTENGYADLGGVNDIQRSSYISLYLDALFAARVKGVHVNAYIHSSLLDGFEWNMGYVLKYGLYQVDFYNQNRTRKAKASALHYKQIILRKNL